MLRGQRTSGCQAGVLSSSIGLFDGKPNGSLVRIRLESEKSPDRVENLPDAPVVLLKLLFEHFETERQFLVRGKHLAQIHKSAHDRDVHLDGAIAFQDAG